MEIPVSRKSFKRDETSQSWDAAAACLASMHLQVSLILRSALPGSIMYVLENMQALQTMSSQGPHLLHPYAPESCSTCICRDKGGSH